MYVCVYIYIYIYSQFAANGPFRTSHPPVVLLRLVIRFLQGHTARVGGQSKFVETYTCYD